MFQSSITETSTIKILDKYIESKEQYFLISDDFNIDYQNKIYDIKFVISNKIEFGKSIIRTNITMTDFKKIYNSMFNDYEKIVHYKNNIKDNDRTNIPKFTVPVLDFIELFFENFETHIDSINTSSEDEIIFFDNPISINAQSSKNRTGYGNEYYYDTLIYEGTKYGETSQFPIVGYMAIINEYLSNYYYK